MAWLYLLYEGDSAQRLWTQWIGTFSEDDDDDDGEAGARATTPLSTPSRRANAY